MDKPQRIQADASAIKESEQDLTLLKTRISVEEDTT